MKRVIFDIDGTLTDTKKVDDTCFIKAFQLTFNLDISNYEWSELQHVTDWGITEEIILKEYKRIPSSLEYQTMKKHFFNQLFIEKNNNSSLFNSIKGATTFFNRIKDHPACKIGIATGGLERICFI